MKHEQTFIDQKTQGMAISTTIRDMLLSSNEFREYVIDQEGPETNDDKPAPMLTGSFEEE